MVEKIVRYVLALILLLFGINKLTNGAILPMPSFPEGSAAGAYMGGLFGSPYFGPLLALTEVIVGLLLAINKFVPLALLIFAPVSINILLFHLTMAPAGGAAGYIVFVSNFYLLFAHKEKYGEILKP